MAVDSSTPCPHITPRLDGAAMRPCDECAPPDPDRFPAMQFTYGKEDWHGDTVRQRIEEHVRDSEAHGRKLGRDYEPAGSRWV